MGNRWRGRLAILVVAAVVLVGCLCEPCSKAKRNEDTVRMAFEAVSAGDLDALDRLIGEDYVRHSQATPELEVTNLDQFKEFLRADRAAFPDQQIELVHLFGQRDLVTFWAVYRATNTGQMGQIAPTGRSVELDVAGVHRVVGGKIVETWVIWDNLTMLTQLGLFPPPIQEGPQE